jgi:hypothetical protein
MANEMVDGLSIVNVSGKFNSIRLFLSALGIVCGSQIKKVNRIYQDKLLDPLHLERSAKFLAKGLKKQPKTPLKGNIIEVINKLKPQNKKNFMQKYKQFINKLFSLNAASVKSVENIFLNKKDLLRFERFAAKVDRSAARSIMTGKTPKTPEGKLITKQMFDSLTSGIQNSPGLKLRTFNSWYRFPSDHKPVTQFTKGKPVFSMPESFKKAMKEQGLEKEEALKVLCERYINEHYSRVLDKIKELKEISKSSLILVMAKMRKNAVPQESIQL